MVSDETYRRGGLVRPGSEPIHGDRAGLEQQLSTISPPENGPDSIIAGVVSLNNEHYLGHHQRQAILLILADLPGITIDTTATDIAGRTGIAVSLNRDGSTKRLIVHPTSGELLAFQETFNACHPPRGGKPCPRPGLFDYRLYLERSRTAPADVSTTNTALNPAPGSRRHHLAVMRAPVSLSLPAFVAAIPATRCRRGTRENP
ncbi:hypothetical protein ACIG87_30835 [Micromonospora sp. NPDC051925]|uniref:hypothetical protein n=1 Tax=Micromonospora sp. NPDC051925 TaxID=3364288 RepID=UPI0037CA35B9